MCQSRMSCLADKFGHATWHGIADTAYRDPIHLVATHQIGKEAQVLGNAAS